MSLSFSTICERMRAQAAYVSHGLRFPRATEAEIQACEERLGFKLPPMLRELYMTVANGSNFFGPGYSFFTIFDDFARTHLNYPILGETIGDGPRVLDDATVEALRAHPGAYVTCPHIPMGFVEFALLGCNVCAYLDGFTGHIYIRDDIYEGDEWNGPTFSFGADTLEEWLERQLAEPWSRSSEWRYQPHEPLAAVLADESKEGAGNGARSGEAETNDSQRASPSVYRVKSDMDRYRNRLLDGLEQARAKITRQIYDLDAVQRGIAEGDAPGYYKRDWLSDLNLTMQQLADVEAQLDDLINTPWLYRT